MSENRKQILNDAFDAFTILAGGNYVSLYDIKGKLTRYSPGAVELFGLPGEYIPEGAFDWSDYIHPEDRKRYQDVMEALIRCETLSYDLTYRAKTKADGYAVFRFMGAVIRDEEGRPDLVGGVMVNEGLLENTDPTTVLRNQYGFFEDLSAMIRSDRPAAVLLIGVGGMTRINAAYGYGYGNRVLQQAGWLLQEVAGENGTVYRMDGAKFAFLTDSLSPQETAALYQTVQRRLQRDIRVERTRHHLASSGGMIVTRGLNMDSRTVYSCLSFAYRESKERKYGALVSFEGMADQGKSLEIISEVRDSVLNGCSGFYVLYQPVVEARTERPLGVEALVRWRDEIYGEVSPSVFLPVLEEDFAFEELGEWIVQQVLSDGKRFLERDPSFSMGLNISAAQLEDEYFLDSLRQSLRRSGFPPENLCLELTKDCRLLDLNFLKETADSLRDQGIRFVIDDFGTGFDSLESLKALSADFVKFDPRLVREIEEKETDRLAMRSLAELASLYGPNVCAKGVENAAMRDILCQYPIGSLQGYLYSRPVPFERAMELCFPS